MKLLNSFFILFFLLSCQQISSENKITQYVEEKTETIKSTIIEKKNNTPTDKYNKNKINKILYITGETYFIEGVKYTPEEDYEYTKVGLATFYGKELHNTKTLNNDLNKVTELLGRHKTLPLPSIVKITNLENGLFLIIKVNDRHDDNSSLIQVSRKVAQLLRFYKNKIARVKVEILSDASKQMKIVTQSMNDPYFEETIDSAPTEKVEITDISDDFSNNGDSSSNIIQPIELGFEDVIEQNLYLKIYDFTSIKNAKDTLISLEIDFNTIIENDNDSYVILVGPVENEDINKLVSSFISKGYKKTEIILK